MLVARCFHFAAASNRLTMRKEQRETEWITETACSGVKTFYMHRWFSFSMHIHIESCSHLIFPIFFFTFSKKQCSMFKSTEKQSLVKLNWYWKATHHKNPWQIISTLPFAARNEQITTDFDLSHSEISTLWFVTGIYVALHSRIIVFNLTETVCFVALATKSNAFIWLIENQWPIIIH